MKLKHKLPLILFIAFVAVISLTFTVSLTNSAKACRKSQYEAGKSMAAVRSEEVKSFLENKITELKALEKSIQAISGLNDGDKAKILSELLYDMSGQPAVSDVYVAFDRGMYFGADKTDSGMVYTIDAFLTESGERAVSLEPTDGIADGDDWYYGPKETRKLHLTEPYEWTYPEETRARKMITLSAPVMTDGKFVGVAGIDLQLDLLQKLLFDNMIECKNGAYAALVSNEGLIAAHPKEELLLTEAGEDLAERQALKDAIKNGSYLRTLKKSRNSGEITLVSYVPMLPDELGSPWSLAYAVSLDAVQAETKKARNDMIILGISCAAAWGAFLLLFMSAIFGKITSAVAALGRMTEGDLTVRFDERGKDEFGQMGRGLNRLLEKLRSMIKTIGRMTEGGGDLTIRFEENSGGDFGQMERGLNRLMEKLHGTVKTTQREAKILSSTSAALFKLSNVLSESSAATLEETISVSRQSMETSDSVKEIAIEAARSSDGAQELSATAEQMGSDMKTVIKAVGDMNENFNRIIVDTLESKIVADKAINRASSAMDVMDALGASVDEIGRFTSVIKTIAKKTKLLSLNAAIEAARAGEAGKGFSVVAGEVKELATQSVMNADDISQRIGKVQAGTAAAISAIREISSIIKKIDRSANSISENVERQMGVSENLTDKAQRTNTGAQQVVQAISGVAASIHTSAQHVDIVAAGAERVYDSTIVIRAAAEKTTADSTELKTAANSLKNMAEQLDSIVCRFRT